MSTLNQVDKISWRRTMGRVAIGAATAALAVTAMGAVPASASTPSAVESTHAEVSAKKYYFAAGLLGRNEVPEPGKKVNDRDGVAVAKFRIHGNRFYYFVQWKRTGKPTAFHIHKGPAGKNGPVVIDLLSNGKIHGNTSFGSVVVKDKNLLKGIKNNPKKWYANLHTAKFPDGAVRGQLHGGKHW
ncbi:CHRD domain-containing protein [Nonomuraea glycinis]|uniref:CHRD domain-containing protein n=1 Tax=Nonomuraea glycinis TaxID=2047744 RepID=UPI001666911D|nr:CHRD domain-containing protein [Nonomuraea glycinis]MCA2182761.1 CHRD domain-containing protein [Nonomuraea glycinis]WSG71154.1 CHRD domain-containing protein [Nonomuraea glycinis]